MKAKKKYQRKQLEKYSAVFMQLGLVLALFIVYVTLEHKTLFKQISPTISERIHKEDFIPIDNPIIIKTDNPKVTKPKKIKPQILDIITKGDDIKFEDIIDIPTDNDIPEIINADDIVEIIEPPVIDNDIPYMLVE
ncbi:hypothetical protein [Lutibacter sp. Hel_I_33_5]|uniref:hypothetical protein n=1 Tax=Lutibacter sp. Hel_I_33_5 TaxID=1566289 RepID=UPI0011A7A86D|nr:hypothetical protein [Lutibacter sp. Hel_I_33_5]